MTQYLELKTAPDVKRVILAAFPSYRKQRAGISAFRGGVNINSYWDGGSRDEYRLVNLLTMRATGTPTSSHPYFDVQRAGLSNQSNSAMSIDHVGNVTLNELPEGYALVSAGTFCGKPATAHVYVNPSNLTPLLAGTGA